MFISFSNDCQIKSIVFCLQVFQNWNHERLCMSDHSKLLPALDWLRLCFVGIWIFAPKFQSFHLFSTSFQIKTIKNLLIVYIYTYMSLFLSWRMNGEIISFWIHRKSCYRFKFRPNCDLFLGWKTTSLGNQGHVKSSYDLSTSPGMRKISYDVSLSSYLDSQKDEEKSLDFDDIWNISIPLLFVTVTSYNLQATALPFETATHGSISGKW